MRLGAEGLAAAPIVLGNTTTTCVKRNGLYHSVIIVRSTVSLDVGLKDQLELYWGLQTNKTDITLPVGFVEVAFGQKSVVLVARDFCGSLPITEAEDFVR